MQHQDLQKLAEAADTEELQRAIEVMCQPFGSPKSIRLLLDREREAHVCLLELGSPNLNESIIEDFGGFYFANGVAFRIPFKQVTGL